MPNPFYYGGGITNPRYFVGRHAELEQILAALVSLAEGQAQHVSIYGPRRIGKSSLLRQVERLAAERLPPGHVIGYLDAQDLPTPPAFAHALARLLGWNLASPEAALQALDDRLFSLEKAPVILLDELDAWLKPDRPMDDRFFDRLRSWMNAHRLAMVVVSKRPLPELVAEGRFTSPFFNIFGTTLALGPLSAAEAEELLANARSCDRPFGMQDIRWLRERARVEGGYHPARLQLAGSLLYEAKAHPPVDYDRLTRIFAARWGNIAPRPGRWQRLGNAAQGILRLPRPLGQALLDLLGRKATTPTTAVFIGWMVVFLILAALAGLWPVSALMRWLLGLLGLGAS